MPEGWKPGAQKIGGETLAVEAIGRHLALDMLSTVNATGQPASRSVKATPRPR
jgi:hypothetical protein